MSDDFDFSASYQDAGGWKSKLVCDSKGETRKTLFNACLALREHPQLAGRIAFDEMSGATFALSALPWDDRANRLWSPFDDLAATEWLQSRDIGVFVNSSVVREAVERVSYENRFHPILQWLEGLEWDGKPRLDAWLSTYLGVVETAFSNAAGRKFLISAVARVMQPGCKVDHMLILEGPQGMLKSTALRTLVGDEWFADQVADLGTKDSSQDLRGKWLVELSEMAAIRPGQNERVKAYVSRQVDHYRPSLAMAVGQATCPGSACSQAPPTTKSTFPTQRVAAAIGP